MRHLLTTGDIDDVEHVDPDTDARVVRERLRLALRGLLPNYFGAVLVSALSAWVLWDEMSHLLLLLWLSYMLLTTAGRAVIGHRDAQQLEQHDNSPSLRAFYVTTLAAGLGWGALGTFLPMLEASDSRALVAVVLAGVTAASTPIYALLLPAARLFLCAALLPAIVFYLPSGSHIDVVIGTMIACYLAIDRHLPTTGLALRRDKHGEYWSERCCPSAGRCARHLECAEQSENRPASYTPHARCPVTLDR